MALPPTTGVQIDDLQAELTGAAKDADRKMSMPQGPDPETFARQICEAMARETWRTDRLSAE